MVDCTNNFTVNFSKDFSRKNMDDKKSLFNHWIVLILIYPVHYSLLLISWQRFAEPEMSWSNTPVLVLIFILSLLPFIFAGVCSYLARRVRSSPAIGLWSGVLLGPLALLLYLGGHLTERGSRKTRIIRLR